MKSGDDSRNAPNPLNPERIARLTKLGFAFSTYKKKTFDERCVEWLEYKTKYNRDPPCNHDRLGQWVLTMRRQYKLFKNGKKSTLTQERFDRLTEWGFRWETNIKTPEFVSPAMSWDERYKQLVEYKKQNGHCNVPQKHPGLGNWVHRQRREYAWYKEGKSSKHMTEDKIKKLKAVGFQWVTRKRVNKSVEETERFKEDGIELDSDDDLNEDEEDMPEACVVERPVQPEHHFFQQQNAIQGLPHFGSRIRYRL
jgi:hypothetical protein